MVSRASTKTTERDWGLRKPGGDPEEEPATGPQASRTESARIARVGLEIGPGGDGRQGAIAGDGTPDDQGYGGTRRRRGERERQRRCDPESALCEESNES